jgi:hypothetical protein
MSDFNLSKTSPQFGTAEYAAAPGGDHCQTCNQAIADSYYRVNGAITCSRCAQETRSVLPVDSHKAYVRGLFYGVGGAVAGLILYSTFAIVTGLLIGFVSLAVGYIVAKSMMKGSGGFGGRRYQVAAALLTYAAVSMSAVPIGISQVIKAKKAEQAAHAVPSPPPAASPQGQTPAEQPSLADDPSAPQQNHSDHSPAKPKMGLGAALAGLALVGLASPFLELQDPMHGLIGLVILFVGIQIAWRIAAGRPAVEITGPFKSSPSLQPNAG